MRLCLIALSLCLLTMNKVMQQLVMIIWMLPKNKLAVQMLSKLKTYTSDQQHPHQSQNPEALDLAVKK